MCKIEGLVTSGDVLLYLKDFEGFDQFYARFTSRYTAKLVIGCGKGICSKNNAYSAIGELVERFAFYNIEPDIVGMRGIDLDEPFVDPKIFQYFSNTQISSGLVPFDRWDPNDVQKWTKMENVSGEYCYFPFEGFKCDRRYIRPTTSGWSVHEDARANVNSALECVERHVVQKYWLQGGPAEEIVVYDNEVIRFLKSVGFCTAIYLICSFFGMYVVIAEVKVTNKNKYNLPSNSKFYSSTCSLSLVDAIEDSLAGAIQKLQWIIEYYARPSKLNIEINPSLFHRMHTQINGGDIRFENNLAKIDVIREVNNFDTNCSTDPDKLLLKVNEILKSYGYSLFQKTYNLYEILNCDLLAAKSVVTGFMPGMFGSDNELPLFNIPDGCLNETYTGNNRYHPFA